MAFPLSNPADEEGNFAGRGSGPSRLDRDKPSCALRCAAAGTLAAGGVLLLSGCRRAGLLTGMAGTALAMIDQQETMRAWWNALPGYLDEAQSFLNRVQGAVDEVTAQQRKVRDMFSRVVHTARA